MKRGTLLVFSLMTLTCLALGQARYEPSTRELAYKQGSAPPPIDFMFSVLGPEKA